MDQDFRIIFMGTPDFAVASLQKLVENNMHVVAVVTAPDKPAGRGKKLKASPVKEYAEHMQLPVLQPTNLKSPEFQEILKAYQANLHVVVAFRMLPKTVWALPPKGAINLHASLLPDYRGAAPINHVIINGEKETGVTTFFINKTIDTGGIIAQKRVPVTKEETAGTLHDKLMHQGAGLLLETIKQIATDTSQPVPQEQLINPNKPLHTASKIFKEDCRIAWDKPATNVKNFIHGLSPYPAAYTTVKHKEQNNPKTLKIFKARLDNPLENEQPGHIQSDGKTYLRIACRDAYLNILELQLEGKKKLPVDAFLRGTSIENYEIANKYD